MSKDIRTQQSEIRAHSCTVQVDLIKAFRRWLKGKAVKKEVSDNFGRLVKAGEDFLALEKEAKKAGIPAAKKAPAKKAPAKKAAKKAAKKIVAE